MKKAPLKKTKCVTCGRLVATVVLGRCPRCMSVQNGLTADDWTFQTNLMRRFPKSNGMTLVCSVARVPSLESDIKWFAIAIESGGTTFEAVFDEHGHKVIGKYATLEAAMRASESFAESWLKDFRASAVSPCDCKEMS